MLKKSALLYPTSEVKTTALIMVGCLLGASLLAFIPAEPPRLLYYSNGVSSGTALQIYPCAALFVIGILLLCKLIGHIPFVSWLGRYSIIVLVTHMPLSAITGTIIDKAVGIYIGDDLKYLLNFVIVILCMLIVIPICKKYLPYITAQKDLLPESIIYDLKQLTCKRATQYKK